MKTTLLMLLLSGASLRADYITSTTNTVDGTIGYVVQTPVSEVSQWGAWSAGFGFGLTVLGFGWKLSLAKRVDF